jgi:hypothetical protein
VEKLADLVVGVADAVAKLPGAGDIPFLSLGLNLVKAGGKIRDELFARKVLEEGANQAPDILRSRYCIF